MNDENKKDENIIEEVCRELTLSKAELAKKLDVSPSSITDWQTKIPKMTRLALTLLTDVTIKKE